MTYEKDTNLGHGAEIMARERVYDGIFKVDRLTIRQTGPSGENTFEREVFERGQSVAVLLYDPVADCVALVEELRAGPMAAGLAPEQWRALGPVAGGIDIVSGLSPEEDAAGAALREVEEETGIVISRDDLHGPLSTMVSPGGTSEVIHHFIACVDLSTVIDGSVHGLKIEYEEIVTRILDRDEARVLVGSGIQNGLAVTLLMLLETMIGNGNRIDRHRNSKHLMDESIDPDI